MIAINDMGKKVQKAVEKIYVILVMVVKEESQSGIDQLTNSRNIITQMMTVIFEQCLIYMSDESSSDNI